MAGIQCEVKKIDLGHVNREVPCVLYIENGNLLEDYFALGFRVEKSE